MKKKETQSSLTRDATQGRAVVGKVVSTKMAKTVIVEVIHTYAHKLYKKTVRRSRRFAAHNEMEGVSVGDTVRIMETRPISKTKHFTVTKPSNPSPIHSVTQP